MNDSLNDFYAVCQTRWAQGRFHREHPDRSTLQYPCYWCGTSGYSDGDCGATSCQCDDVLCGKCAGTGELDRQSFLDVYEWWKQQREKKRAEEETREQAEFQRLKAKFEPQESFWPE